MVGSYYVGKRLFRVGWSNLGLELSIHELDSNRRLSDTAGTHHYKVIGTGSLALIFIAAIGAKLPPIFIGVFTPRAFALGHCVRCSVSLTDSLDQYKQERCSKVRS